ncbi:MAG TPA: hypothetical protein VF748_14745 [Candidatus Acidoferrum sp.]
MAGFFEIFQRFGKAAPIAESVADADALAKDALAVENAGKFLQAGGQNIPADKAAAIDAAIQGGWKPAPVRLNAAAKKDWYGQQPLPQPPPALPPAVSPTTGQPIPRITVQPQAPAAPAAPAAAPRGGASPFLGNVPAAPAAPPRGGASAFLGPAPAAPAAPTFSSILGQKPKTPAPTTGSFGQILAKAFPVGAHGATPSAPSLTSQLAGALVQAKAAKPVKPAAPFPGLVREGGAQPGGHVAGGFYRDRAGERWYVKTEKDQPLQGVTGAQLARNEALASSLYRIAGAVVPDMEISGASIKTRVTPGMKQLHDIPGYRQDQYGPEIRKDIAADAWVANWDVHEGNILADPNDPKKIMRIDQGGALEYMGMGEPKTYKGMADPGVGMSIISSAERDVRPLSYIDAIRTATPADWAAAAKKLGKIKREDVQAAVDKYGPTDPQARINLVNLLMRRRASLMERFSDTAMIAGFPPQEGAKRRAAIMGEQTKMFGRARGSALTMQEPGIYAGGFHPAYASREDAETAFPFAGQDIKELVASTKDYLRYDAKGADIRPEMGSHMIMGALKKAKAEYWPGIIFENVVRDGKKQTIFINLDAPLLRGANAKFDPTKMHLDNLLASGAAVAVGTAAYMAAGGTAKAEEVQPTIKYSSEEFQEAPSTSAEFRRVTYAGKTYQVPKDMAAADTEKYIISKKKESDMLAGIPPAEGTTYQQELNKLMMESHESLHSGWNALFAGELPDEPPEWLKKVAKDEGKEWTEGEKRAWQVVKGAGEVASGVLGGLFNWGIAGVHTLIDQQDERPEVKEAEKTIADFFMPAGGLGALMKAPKMFKAGQRAFTASPIYQKTRDGVKAILSPDKVDADSQAAAALIREKTGEAARSTSATMKALKDDPTANPIRNVWVNYERRINAMTPQDQLRLIHYMQTRSQGAVLHDPELQAFADEFRNAMEQREIKLSQTPALAAAFMQEDYVSQYWKNTQAAAQFLNKWIGKQGAGGPLKKKKWPTYADGIAAGLEPLTTNPIEIGQKYVSSMDRFIAHNQIMDVARTNGDVKFFTPGSRLAKRYEALGWIQLDGILAEKRTPQGAKLRAFAPESWARPYNNFVSRGVYGRRELGNAYDVARNTQNAITQLVLGVSGYHLLNIAWEAVASPAALLVSQTAGAVGKASRGEVLGALKLLGGAAKTLALAPTRPLTGLARGRKLEQIYLNLVPATRAIDKEMMKLYTQAGGRHGQRFASPDYTLSAAGSFFDSFKRAGMRGIGQDVYKDFSAYKGVAGKTYAFGKQIGRVMDTVLKPLFDYYIPKMKLAAFSENMAAWVRANPFATDAEKLAVSRKVLDSIDNRFGEMIQDNLFWNAGLRQGANLGLLAFSWTYGTIREVGGGMLAGIKNPKAITMRGDSYDPRIGYIVGLPIAAFFVSNIYSYMKGDPPQSFADALDNTFAPKTGGTSPGVGGRGQVPERAALPGNLKDILGYYNDFRSEAYNKLGPELKIVVDMLLKGTDWSGKPISPTEWSDVPGWMMDYFNYFREYQPISVQQLSQGQKRGSAITRGETLMGIRPAPMWEQDPEGMRRFIERRNRAVKLQRMRQEMRKPNLYGGPQE